MPASITCTQCGRSCVDLMDAKLHKCKGRKSERPHKYSAQGVRDHDGTWHPSKAERRRWAELGMLLKSGKVTMIAKQPRTWLGVTDNTYRPDFWVCGGLREIHPSAKRDAPEWAEDVKGYEPREFKRIKKAWRIHGWLPLVVLFSVKGGWRREFIWPDRAGSMEAP